MKAAIGLLAIAIALAGCTQKSDVDKCVEAWDATVTDMPENKVKAEMRLNARGWCMRQTAQQK